MTSSPIAPTAPARSARISPDRPWVGVAATLLVLIVMLASMVFSFAALSSAASWTHNQSWTFPLAAVFLDGAILVFSMSLVVFRWRGQDSTRTLAILIGFTTLSCAINIVHAGSGWEWNLTLVEAWGGMVIAGSAPIAALLSAEEVTRLAFQSPADVPVAVARTAAAPAVEPDSAPAVEPEPEAEPAETERSHPVLELPPVRVARPRQPLLTFATEN